MSNEMEEREIRCGGDNLGAFKLQKLYRAITRGDFEQPLEFRSIRTNEWLPIAGILEDFNPTPEKVKQMQETGFTKVRFLDGGGDDCLLCKEIASKAHNIDNVPAIPPISCTCVPWCRLTVVVSE